MAVLGRALTPRTADKLRLPIKQLVAPSPRGSSPYLRSTRSVDAHGRPLVKGLRGASYTPPPVGTSGAHLSAASERTRRTGDDTPLNSSARKRLSSGASWLGELRLRAPTPRARPPSARRQPPHSSRFAPICSGTPRDERGNTLTPSQIKAYFEAKQRETAASGSAAKPVDPMMYVKRGEMSDYVQLSPTRLSHSSRVSREARETRLSLESWHA